MQSFLIRSGISETELPKSILGRIGLAMVCMFFAPLSTLAVLLLMFFAPTPQSLVGWAFRLTGDIVLIETAFFSVFGFLWSVTQWPWVERIVLAASRKLKMGLCVFAVLLISGVIWMLK